MEDKNKRAEEAILNAVAPISLGPDYSTKAIAVYLEVEYHDCVEGANWIINNTNTIGEAIAQGVCNYFGVNYKLG